MRKMYKKPETDEVKVTAMGWLLVSGFIDDDEMPGLPHPVSKRSARIGLPSM